MKLPLFAIAVGNDRERRSPFLNAIRFAYLQLPYRFKRGANVEGYPKSEADFLINRNCPCPTDKGFSLQG